MSTTPSRFGFHGREKELAWLRSHFDAVAARGADGKFAGPRMAFIVAESGIGKSRLVQELYIRLTNDPQWDPPEVDYWPDAFGDGGVNLTVAPDMHGHVAKGPPRFLWLGARWSDPDERNAVQSNALPDLSRAICGHAEIFDSYRSAWASLANRTTETVRREIGDEIAGEAVERVIEAAVNQSFLAGLVVKLGKSAAKFAKDRHEGPRAFESIEERQEKSLVDDLVDSFRLMLGSRDSVPAVLWLDDAQWADEEARQFVAKLWEQATKRRWPLLIVVTHWEREWRVRKLGQIGGMGPGAPEFVGFEGRDGVDVLVLEHATAAALESWLSERLPGLTAPHRALLLEKAAGNFRQMAENLGELLSRPRNFEGGDATSSLSGAGERLVRTWKIDRSERVQQRFNELGQDVQDLLGWSSQLGTRFLREVASAAAREIAGRHDAPRLLDQCVDPFVILGQPSPNTSEFRDRAFHAVADGYFGTYLEEHRATVSAVLRRHLVEWINNSFDAQGNVLCPNKERGIASPERSAAGLSDDERRDLLGMAMRELPLPNKPDWNRTEDIAAFRAVYMVVMSDRRQKLWNRVSERLRLLAGWPFAEMPGRVLSVENLDWLFWTAETAGAFLVAERIAEAALAERRRLHAEEQTAGRLRDVSMGLTYVGRILEARSDWRRALERYNESLAIARRLLDEDRTAERLRDVSWGLIHVGHILAAWRDWPRARERFRESLEISRRLLAEEATPQRILDVSSGLFHLGRVLQGSGDLAGALAKYEENLGIERRLLAGEATARGLYRVSWTLMFVGIVLETRRDWAGALERYEESLGIMRRLLAEEETVDLLRDVSENLTRVGSMLAARRDWTGALERYEESLTIRRRLLAEEETANRLRDVSVSLDRVGSILRVRGDARGALEVYGESLAIRRRLLREFGRPTPQWTDDFR